MRRILIGLGIIAACVSCGMLETAFAQSDGKQRDRENWHSGAYDSERGTNFASPTGYARFIPVQGGDGAGSGGDGAAAGDGGSAGAAGAAGAAGGNGDGCR